MSIATITLLIFLLIIVVIVGVLTILAEQNLKLNSAYATDLALSSAGEYLIYSAVTIWVVAFLMVIGAISYFIVSYRSKDKTTETSQYFFGIYVAIVIIMLLIVGFMTAIAATKMSSSTNFDPKTGSTDLTALTYTQVSAGLSLGVLCLLLVSLVIYLVAAKKCK